MNIPYRKILYNYASSDQKAEPIKYAPKPMNTATQKSVIAIRVRSVQNRWDLKINKATTVYQEKSVSQ